MSAKENKAETLDSILIEAQNKIGHLFQEISQKNKGPLQNSEDLSTILYYFENLQNANKSFQEIFRIKREIMGVFRGILLLNNVELEINEKKKNFENFCNENIQKINSLNIIKSITKESKSYIDLIKNIQKNKKNSDELSKENFRLKEEFEKLKTKTDELNKENSGLKLNQAKKEENLLKNLIKNEDQLLDKHDEVLLKRKKRELSEKFGKEIQALKDKIQELENENMTLFTENLRMKGLEANYRDIKARLPTCLQKTIIPKMAIIFRKEILTIKEKYDEMNTKFKRLIEINEKLQQKFDNYKGNYIKYYQVYHSGNILNIYKEFFTSYNNNIDKKIIFENMKEGDMGLISIQFPEFYKYIDRKFLEKKIQMLLYNIMKLNQFAKIFLKIIIDIFPNPSSTDKDTLDINEQIHEIIDSLQTLDKKMNVETEKIRENLSIICDNSEDESKNLVGIFEKCFEFESECVNHIMNLDSKYIFFFNFIIF